MHCIPSYYLIQTSKAKILLFLKILRRNCFFLKEAGFTLWGKLYSLSKLHLFSNTSPLRIVCTFPFQCQNWKCNRQHHIDWSDISGKNCSNEMIFLEICILPTNTYSIQLESLYEFNNFSDFSKHTHLLCTMLWLKSAEKSAI